MRKKLEKSEARELVEEIGWTALLPENTEVDPNSPTDHELSASVKTTVGLGKTDVQKAYSVTVKSGQRTYSKPFTADTEAANYLEGVAP